MANNLIIKNISTLYTPEKGKIGVIKEYDNVNIIITDGLIEAISETEIDVNALKLENYGILDAKGLAVLPGFVDSHAHPIFAKTREAEFEMRNMGKSYLEIAESGGGIMNSVRKLREMDEECLLVKSEEIIKSFLEFGTTTLEAKSGYGLTLEDELKMLKVIKKLDESSPIDLVPTFLGAHGIPAEFKEDREQYIELVINEMIPEVAKQGLAEACDIFIEKNYYTIEEGRRILSVAQKHGLEVKIHADQLTCNGGSELAAELKALSADHLEYISDKAIDKMIENNVVFNFLPGATYFVGIDDYPPARKIIEKGGIYALATDFNPGTCFVSSIPLIMNVAAIKMHMTAEELLWASTMGGAMALKREKLIGSVEKGKKADMLLVDIDNIQQLPYSLGVNLVKKVIKNGLIVK